MKKIYGLVGGAVLSGLVVFFAASTALAGAQGVDERVRGLEKRIEHLEEKQNDLDVTSERSHRLHPVHSEFGLEITGGMTFTVQGVANVESLKRSEAAISGDLAIEGPIGEKGMAVIVLDFQRGLGIDDLGLMTAPNGNPTGTNADVESFNDTSLKVTQLYYEHHFLEGALTLSIGQLDITGYLDANNFANDETAQFMANVFVNNPSIEFGGTDNFYSPGLVVVFAPHEALDITLGVFDGNGDYARPFDDPFVLAELDFKATPLGREGAYRVYYWRRSSRPAANLEFLADTTNAALVKAYNQGVGLSLDQYLTGNIGAWLRAGTQRETISQMKAFIGAGLYAAGIIKWRESDSMGLGFGMNLPGKDYKDFKKATDTSYDPGNEHYMEVYYDVFLGGRGGMGFHVAPDLQYVINRGGNRKTADALVYGMRLQADF